MKIRSVCLAALAAFSFAAPLGAQPETPRALQPKIKEAAPMINPEAKALVDGMIARYAALKSYSDTTRAGIEGGGNLPKEMGAGFPVVAKLAWERPAKLRFEGTSDGKAFLGLSDEKFLHVVSPDHPGFYEERLHNPPLVVTHPDGHTETFPPNPTPVRLDEPQMESGAFALGSAFMTEPEFWTRTLKDVTVVALELDAVQGGEACRVVNVQAQGDQRDATLIRLWIAESDGLLRRMELSDGGMGGGKIIETHSDVRLNPALPPSTWVFQAPANTKPVEFFSSLNPHQYDPTIKVGDSLPTFSGDALDGKPLELNPKDGKVTLLSFFTLEMGTTEANALQGLQKTFGAGGLNVIAVSGAGRRERLEKFVADNKLTIPVYFDENGMNNRLAGLFGVRSWTTTLLFDRQGKLQVIGSQAMSPEIVGGLKKLFPGATDTTLYDAMDNNAPPNSAHEVRK